MIMSKKISDERMKELLDLPVTYDDELPKMTENDYKSFSKPHFQKYKEVTLKIDSGILDAFCGKGFDLEKYVNSSLRAVVNSN